MENEDYDLDISDEELLEEEEEIKVDEEKARIAKILENATTEQFRRYEAMKNTFLFRPKGESKVQTQTKGKEEHPFKKLTRNIIGQELSDNTLTILSGASKIYIGELVEKALEVAKQQGDEGPLQPFHLQEARRMLRSTTKRIL